MAGQGNSVLLWRTACRALFGNEVDLRESTSFDPRHEGSSRVPTAAGSCSSAAYALLGETAAATLQAAACARRHSASCALTSVADLAAGRTATSHRVFLSISCCHVSVAACEEGVRHIRLQHSRDVPFGKVMHLALPPSSAQANAQLTVLVLS